MYVKLDILEISPETFVFLERELFYRPDDDGIVLKYMNKYRLFKQQWQCTCTNIGTTSENFIATRHRLIF
jgi:hypothetical protein